MTKKIIITEDQLQRLSEYMLKESIRAREATNQTDSILTLLNRKRNLAFITFGDLSPDQKKYITKLINSDPSLNSIHVKKSPFMGFVIYRQGNEKEAQELADIADKYGGYLSPDATKEDSIKIGQLLNYNPKDIEDYINKNYDKYGINYKTGNIFESELDEVAKTTNDLPPDTGLYSDVTGNDVVLSLLSGTTSGKNKLLGSIAIDKINGNTYTVTRVYAEPGYGPLFYDIALSHVYPASLMPDRSGLVNKEAMNVWRYYTHNRPDTKKEVLKPEDEEYNLNLIYTDESNMGREEMIYLAKDPINIKNWGEDMVIYNTKFTGKPLNLMPLKKVAFNAFKNNTVDRKILRGMANNQFLYSQHPGFKELDDLANDYEELT